MKSLLCCALAVMVLTLPLPAAETNAAPVVGGMAPLVEGRDQDGKEWKLSGLVGKKLVLLYFYPKDDTPGCTREACSWRDRTREPQWGNVQVVGVSSDPTDSHQRFIEKYSLNFPLLADPEGTIANAYGVRQPGKKTFRRVSFLIGLDGKIAHITDTSKADVHVAEMTEAIARLGSK